jgi:ABC-2 type transport system permease protein
VIRSFRAEMLKLRRPATLFGAGAVVPLLAVLGTVLDFVTASDAPGPRVSPVGGTSLLTTVGQLAQPGGLTIGYTNAATFVGILVFVLFITSMSGEYGQGTIRMLLTQQPRRIALLSGKLGALLVFTAVVLLAAELLAGVAAVIMAYVRDIPTTEWFTSDGWSTALTAYANSVLTAMFFGCIGAALGITLRSTPLALGVGLAWIGPLEHIVQLTWSHSGRWFPGLVFDAVSAGGSPQTTYGRALLLASGYALAGLVLAAGSFARRDVVT